MRRGARDLAVGTVAAKSYLPFARVLARALSARHPDLPFFVLLADEVDGCFDPETEPFETIRLAEVGIPDLRRFLFRYTRREAAVAVKSHLLGHLLGLGFRRALFLDADLRVDGDLAPLLAAVGRSPLVLTPHVAAPLPGPGGAAGELAIVRAGALNGGVVGVADHPEGRRFVAWWQARLARDCRLEPAAGLHHDQAWLALAPGLFDGVEVLRDPTLNVAYWNAEERGLHFAAGEARVRGGPVRLFHFSGFDPDRPERLTRHAELPPPEPGLRDYLRRYAGELAAAGWRESRQWSYAYGAFDDGSPIPEVAREVFRALGAAADRFGDPFSTSRPDCFADWLVPLERAPDLAATPLWAAVLERRPDVRAVFRDPSGADREGFRRWASSSGAREHGIAARFLPARADQ